MTWFQNTYTPRFNIRHRLWSHLFGGSYKAIPVEAEVRDDSRYRCDYLTTLIDYIHINPARAGLADGRERSLLDYPWSSLAQAYAKPPTKRPKWMSVGEGLELFGERDRTEGRRRMVERTDRRAAEEEAEMAGLVQREGQSLQSTLRRGWYWGGAGFPGIASGSFWGVRQSQEEPGRPQQPHAEGPCGRRGRANHRRSLSAFRDRRIDPALAQRGRPNQCGCGMGDLA